MQPAQQAQFAERIQRIQSGGPNTFATVYTGLQDVDTPAGKKVSGVQHKSAPVEGRLSAAALLSLGLKSGLLKLVALGSGILLFLHFAGV
ncbi:hypothetical protein [Celeribacter ethanolicus]|uniref:Uncharacterized protein n=1 Tax=Celeribacter ethanolicus TaxID=1758178 RepID=A0A291G8N8_9RHOB|nr:hypothetical protein [Celeribacter ethanolicus]ATG46412.1 hypothetical protein CEW89_01810 [Celeribacter ethanolicus]TNE69695.1 MAG: hypothetical protein EP336_01665 [Paracoccaceae bacterium]